MTAGSATRRLLLTTIGAERCKRDLAALRGIEPWERYDLGDTLDADSLSEALDGSWAIVAGSEPYTRAVLSRAQGLRAIVRWGAGSDAIDIEAASDASVAVLVTPGANADAVADLALALMLSCLRRLPQLDLAVRDGGWRPAGLSRDLAGARVGVVGLGAIGRAVARRVRGFGCEVLAVEPEPDLEFCAAHEIAVMPLDELLPCVDVLTLHCALTPSTRHLIGAPELALMRPDAILVNTARGPLVDQGALVAALRDGGLAGAGLDVFETEPVPPADPLLDLPNVVLSGHAASFTELAMRRTAAAVIAHLRELSEGRLPSRGCLNPQAWG